MGRPRCAGGSTTARTRWRQVAAAHRRLAHRRRQHDRRLGADDHAHDVAEAIRRTMAAERPDAWLLAEHGHDASLDLAGAGWHGTMDYAGSTRPVWSWLNGAPPGSAVPHGLQFLGLPVPIPVRPGGAVVGALRDAHAAMPWQSRIASTSHLDSTTPPASARSPAAAPRAGGRRRPRPRATPARAGAADDAARDPGRVHGRRVRSHRARRRALPHADALGPRAEWDEPTYDAYLTWTALRREHVALRRGGLRWVHVQDDSLTYLREHDDETLLVHVARAPTRWSSRSPTWAGCVRSSAPHRSCAATACGFPAARAPRSTSSADPAGGAPRPPRPRAARPRRR